MMSASMLARPISATGGAAYVELQVLVAEERGRLTGTARGRSRLSAPKTRRAVRAKQQADRINASTTADFLKAIMQIACRLADDVTTIGEV